jgi:hypothetical protein
MAVFFLGLVLHSREANSLIVTHAEFKVGGIHIHNLQTKPSLKIFLYHFNYNAKVPFVLVPRACIFARTL